jgi:hypothetical protein
VSLARRETCGFYLTWVIPLALHPSCRSMNTKLIKSLVELVKAEEQNRETARLSMSPDAADYQATFHDTPLTNELYLLVLLFVCHEIEKEIVLVSIPRQSRGL